MRFIHIADMHFDTPFTFLNTRDNLGNKRRLEQRQIFSEIINYIKENNISYLFICGDLYDHSYIKETTIEFINNLFKTIPNTKIFIVPGNHDPIVKNSYYATYNWSKNVYIFSSELNFYEFDDVDIYGFGFSDFYCKTNTLENIKIKNKNKINVLLTHGTLNASEISEMQYNPILESTIKSLGFDYVGLGHIHKREIFDNNIVYPGSAIALGFDELGEHGIMDVNLDKNNLNITFIKMDNTVFEEFNLNISEIKSEEELIEKINSLKLEENKLYKLNLIGLKNIEININKILKIINKKNILKIKDLSKLEFNLEKILEQNNLKSFFIQELLKEKSSSDFSDDDIEKALEIGLNALQS